MKRMAMAVGAVGLLVAAALAGGWSRTVAVPESGEAALVNNQANMVWTPRVMALTLPDAQVRTVTVSRVLGDLEYPIAVATGAVRTFIYEFEADYWSGLSNGVKVTIRPACTGILEVIRE